MKNLCFTVPGSLWAQVIGHYGDFGRMLRSRGQIINQDSFLPVTGCKIDSLRCQGGNKCLVNTIFHLVVKICLDFSEDAGLLESQSFRGRQASSQLCFTFARRQGLPAFLHPFLDSLQGTIRSPTSLHLASLVLESMVQQILGIPLKPFIW